MAMFLFKWIFLIFIFGSVLANEEEEMEVTPENMDYDVVIDASGDVLLFEEEYFFNLDEKEVPHLIKQTTFTDDDYDTNDNDGDTDKENGLSEASVTIIDNSEDVDKQADAPNDEINKGSEVKLEPSGFKSIFAEIFNRNQLHRKCTCQEVTDCFSETIKNWTCKFKDATINNSGPEDFASLFSKCSVKVLKDNCNYGRSVELKLFENNIQNVITALENFTSEIYSFHPNAEEICLQHSLLSCFHHRKSCFIEDSVNLMNQTISFCTEKMEKLGILKAFKLSKNDVISLKKEYFETFDEEFEGNLVVAEVPNENGDGLISQWFHNWHKKLCYILYV